VLNKVAGWRAPKRFSAPKIGKRLQQAGFARRVRTNDQRVIRVRFQLDGCQTPKGLRRETLYRHVRNPRASSEPHRHNHELAVILSRSTYQTAGIAVHNR